MDRFDAALTQAEQQKAAADPVRQAQAELAPVRAWAQKGEQDFLAGAVKLQPRMEKALARMNRLTALMGGQPGEPLRLWQEVEKVKGGVPQAYRKIIADIDALSGYLVGQPYYMNPLRQKRNCPPGTIGHLVEALERVERSLDQYAAVLEEAGGAGSGAVGIIPEDRGPASIPVEMEFTPQMPRFRERR